MSRTLWIAVLVLVAGVMLFNNESFRIFRRGNVPGALDLKNFGTKGDDVQAQFDSFWERFHKGGDVEMVNNFYNLITEFYEYGWGQSFHFAHTLKDESHDGSIARHERRISDEIGLKPGVKAIDVGCGVGGPLREIARHSGANIVGITINAFQVERGNNYTKAAKLDHLAKIVQGDFTKMTNFSEGTFDRAYAIEATCHAPDLADVYSQVFRTLKPGGLFASYEWVTTKNYDANNPEHVKAVKNIEYGDALPPLRTYKQIEEVAKKVGFKLLKKEDLAEDKNGTRGWWSRLEMHRYWYKVTHAVVTFLEWIGYAPKGTVDAHHILIVAADGLISGGTMEIFTPMYLYVFQKPEAAAPAAAAK